MLALFLFSFAAPCSAYKCYYNTLSRSQPDPLGSWSNMAYPPGYGGRDHAASDAQFLIHFDASNVTDFVHVNNVYKGVVSLFEFSKIHFFASALLLCFFCSITLSFGDSIGLMTSF